MSLKHLFEQICCSDPNMLPEEDPIGLRIMCPEYSLHAGDRTQIHTHEYLELAYVISGRFRQCIQGKDILFSQGAEDQPAPKGQDREDLHRLCTG